MSQKNKIDFSDFFIQPSNEEWKKKILDELGNHSDEILKWKYKNFSFEKVVHGVSTPTHFSSSLQEYFQLKSPRHWYNREFIKTNSIKDANLQAHKALLEGADAFEFHIENKNILEIDSIISGLPTEFTPVHFYISHSIEKTANQVKNLADKNLKGSLIHTSFIIQQEKNTYLNELNDIIKAFGLLKEQPKFKFISIQTNKLFEKGLSTEIEISYAIAAFLDIADKLTDYGIPLNEIISRCEFSFSAGKSFLVEIAKLRAFRWVLNEVLLAWEIDANGFSIPLHVRTANETFSSDIHSNILHNTTEAMSAVIGGCDSLTIIPFDVNEKESNSFSSRISRNISSLLKEESYFSAVTDPGAGSYVLENLTSVIAEKSLSLLKEIEKKGGLSAYLKA